MVPTVATIAIGRYPPARSSAIACRARPRPSRTARSPERGRAKHAQARGSCTPSRPSCAPRPRRRRATRHPGLSRAARPRAAASVPAASRAAASAISVEVDAVSVRSPSNPSGNPTPAAASRRRPPRAPCRSVRSATASGSDRGPPSTSPRGFRGPMPSSRNRRGTPGVASAWRLVRPAGHSRPGSPRSTQGPPAPRSGTADRSEPGSIAGKTARVSTVSR